MHSAHTENYVFLAILTVNSDCFAKRHQSVGRRCIGDAEFPVRYELKSSPDDRLTDGGKYGPCRDILSRTSLDSIHL
jgi:hypothetical protein